MTVCPSSHGWRALLLILAILLAPAAAAAQNLRSTRDMAALPPAVADRVVRRDLLSVLTPINHRLGGGMRIRLDDVWLSARPYGTAFSGLCRLDTLILKYGPVEASAALRDQKLQPYGFESASNFHALRAPAAATEDYRAKDYIWSSDCDRLDPDQAGWFAAKDEREAARGVNFLKAAVDAVRSGKLTPTSCDLPPAERADCRGVVLRQADLGKITDIASCAAANAAVCFRIETADFVWLEIVGTTAADDSLAPTGLQSLKVGFYIVVT